MKKLLLLLCLFPSVIFAGVAPVREQPINSLTETCVDITTYTFTAVPTTPLASRAWVSIGNPSTVTLLGTTNSSLGVTGSTAPIVVPPSDMVQLPYGTSIATYFRYIGPNGNSRICAEEALIP